MKRIGLALAALTVAVALAGAPQRALADDSMAPTKSEGKSAKRVGPPEVAPVTVGSLRIEALPWGRKRGFDQNGGYVAAIDTATGEEVWTLKIYDVVYDAGREEDVQDIFIEDMRLRTDERVEITDEDGRKYLLDVEKRIVKPF